MLIFIIHKPRPLLQLILVAAYACKPHPCFLCVHMYKNSTFCRLAKNQTHPSIAVAGLGVLSLQYDSFMLHMGML